jgi:hypothetical protein
MDRRPHDPYAPAAVVEDKPVDDDGLTLEPVPVPEHAVEVIQWVGRSRENAQRAFDAEMARPPTRQRASVLEHVNAVLDAG